MGIHRQGATVGPSHRAPQKKGVSRGNRFGLDSIPLNWIRSAPRNRGCAAPHGRLPKAADVPHEPEELRRAEVCRNREAGSLSETIRPALSLELPGLAWTQRVGGEKVVGPRGASSHGGAYCIKEGARNELIARRRSTYRHPIGNDQ